MNIINTNTNINQDLKMCTNCGKHANHDYKSCSEPITSWGIIAVKIDDDNSNIFNSMVQNMISNTSDIKNGINIESNSDIEKIKNKFNKLKFLMISRKHSLGYVEFIRGRYKPKNIQGLIYMFKQMTNEEIQRIGSKSFEELWDEFWGDSKKNKHGSEYTESKNNFDQLKNKIGVELALNFYTSNITAKYEISEWGFPKGRKNKGESDMDCAVREFCEETSLDKTDIQLNSKTIVENLIGTNGIKYRHIYYLAEIKTTKDIKTFFKNSKNNEIGDINLFTYDEANSMIRDYHVEKKNIITNIFMEFLNT